jgi:beta-xylosidase
MPHGFRVENGASCHRRDSQGKLQVPFAIKMEPVFAQQAGGLFSRSHRFWIFLDLNAAMQPFINLGEVQP